ncbi:glycerophosphodiester phosphodiesterase family protein [Dinghuibacter silviterrae]|uniref:Glycerophosphoryl diester phosphodiesterase n=1 Tax=Dinghuibacter silviterrae TaxID=1539049 RepID=A0A4R8DFZ5_9BACT|nr:glycerophosphodiester phosphodiesterase family protein [Dinghuibacter silviterrae]TDW95880.1 glycerophosphoryl diester phosphodiesterase [Dinghuibacter silviterrae]
MLKPFLYAAFLAAVCAQPAPRPLPKSAHTLVVISHRGYHLRLPENSVAAVDGAIGVGADYVEIDLRTSLDGKLVLSHDATLDRMTHSHAGNVSDLTLAQIRQLTLYSPDTADKTIYRVPEFKEVLNRCKGRINIYLDFKVADVAETWKQIRQAGMEKQVVVYLNKPGQYEDWRRIAPDMPLMASLPDECQTEQQVDSFFRSTPVEVLDNVSDPVLLRAVNKHGAVVWLDVQSADEDAAKWHKAIDMGVQGLQTDHPADLVAFLLGRGGSIKKKTRD